MKNRFSEIQPAQGIDNIIKDVVLDLHNLADDYYQDGDIFTAFDLTSFIKVLEVSLEVLEGAE